MGLGGNGCRPWTFFGDMSSFSPEQAQAVVHMALMLLKGQFAILAQFPSHVWTRFWVLWGLALNVVLEFLLVFRLPLGSTLLVGLASCVILAFHSQYR